jgi:hypothetical protein
MATKNLSKEDVKRLVYAYKDPKITDELYSFGSLLLADVRGRSGNIDSKAATILGWATGILAFLFTELSRSRGCVELMCGVASGLCCLVAAIYAFLALRARTDWHWPSDRDWFTESALSSANANADNLKRFYVRSLHDTKQAQLQVTDRKGKRLLVSQYFLVAGAVLFALGIASKLILR